MYMYVCAHIVVWASFGMIRVEITLPATHTLPDYYIQYCLVCCAV